MMTTPKCPERQRAADIAAELKDIESFQYDEFDKLMGSSELCFDDLDEEAAFWDEMRAPS